MKEESKVALTAAYIEQHQAVHTADSFGRALTEQVLRAAKERLGTGSAESITLDAKITVTPFVARGCLTVCIGIPPATVCYHSEIRF